MNWTHFFEDVISGRAIERDIAKPSITWTFERAIWRLWQAKKADPRALLDHAILIRQCLRWLGSRRIRGDYLNEGERRCLESVGIRLSLSGYLEVEPYRPQWLSNGTSDDGLDALPQVASVDESFPAEEWVRRTTGKATWRSHAQKEACWTALMSQPGETNLIGLPTGAGKSLVFQVAAAVSSGLTVVVVPTVALGLDQLAIAKTLPTAPILNPVAYDSGDMSDAVKEIVANRQSRLLFTSPEACVSGRLRAVLDRHASDGWLQWVVVDEAHIVESWGADFRIEFQLLGALVREWRQRSDNRLRTLLLSATFADSTQDMLRGLFVERAQPWRANVVHRLRAEIHYHICRATTAQEQAEWVEDAILHLPRPMILYVTEKAEARQWYERALALGLSRVACFHGDTPARERNRIMDAWRSDRTDLMIATSAFGMGVDKPDVRAVLHACFPESIDRFYQEVGRGGRDGATTQSMLIYTERDKWVGKGLAPTLLLPETVNDRWSALWNSRQVVDGTSGSFQVRTDARRMEFVGLRTYQENVRWNKRLLQMMHRAALLTITGLHTEKVGDNSEEYLEWVTISGLMFPTVDHDVGGRLSALRNEELKNIQDGFIALENCTRGSAICRELQKHYGKHVVRACGSCAACRLGSETKRVAGSLLWPEDSILATPTVYLVPMKGMGNGNGRPDWIMSIRKTIDQRVASRFVVAEADYEAAIAIFAQAISAVALRLYRIDCLRGDQVPNIESRERIVALHLSGFQTALAAFNRYGAMCSHWVPSGHTFDGHGRSRFTQEHGARLFDSFESWLFENETVTIS